jgi:hypothetical protein
MSCPHRLKLRTATARNPESNHRTGIIMSQSLTFGRRNEPARAPRRASIWTELVGAIPIVIFVLAAREAWKSAQRPKGIA